MKAVHELTEGALAKESGPDNKRRLLGADWSKLKDAGKTKGNASDALRIMENVTENTKAAVTRRAKDILATEQEKYRFKRNQILPKYIKKFRIGSIYNPTDFALRNTAKPTEKYLRKTPYDQLDEAEIDPLQMYKDVTFLSDFISPVGRIYSRNVTQLTAKNHRRISRSIKRARMAGLLSTTHRSTDKLFFRAFETSRVGRL
ncbi:ribosomal protein S18 [Dipodascopsis uninucleata]